MQGLVRELVGPFYCLYRVIQNDISRFETYQILWEDQYKESFAVK